MRKISRSGVFGLLATAMKTSPAARFSRAWILSPGGAAYCCSPGFTRLQRPGAAPELVVVPPSLAGVVEDGAAGGGGCSLALPDERGPSWDPSGWLTARPRRGEEESPGSVTGACVTTAGGAPGVEAG